MRSCIAGTGNRAGRSDRQSRAAPVEPGIFLAREHRRVLRRAMKEDAVPRLPTGLTILSLVIALTPRIGEAEPPTNADPALRPWFESLKQPGTGVSCCSISDCRPVQYRLASDGYEALIDSGWVRVPEDK